ncbi:MAG: hypothetical protein KA524_10755 [Nitrosomonas sp.]|nr:hypothetical protein [Nitrosomonas sp.]MBP6076863.1 hypothetical protein [Nitrosomonas sp.]
MSRLIAIGILLTVAITSQSGCSTQQLYNTGQSWQRNECNRLMDQQERDRCLSSTSTSYEAYKKQSATGNEQK